MRIKNYWLILIFLVAVFLRLPSLFEPFTYGDEGIYLTLGLAIRRGLTLYRDIHDNKPPLLYLLAALVGNFAYFRALLFAWSLMTIYVFSKLAEKIFDKNQMAVIVSTFAFGILTSIHTFEGNIANAENFMMLPTLVGIYLVLKGLNKHGLRDARTSKAKQSLFASRADLRRLFLAGIMFSLATLFKVPAAFDFLAILFFLGFVFLKKEKKKDCSLFTVHCSLFVAGFLLPLLITIIYYAAKGALSQYLSAAFLQNIPYLTSWGTGFHAGFNPLRSGLFIRGILLLVACYVLRVASKKFSWNFLFVSLWFTFSLFAALLSARPYPHYLIQVLPSLSLLLGFLTLRVRKERLLVLIAFALFAFSFYFYKFWYYSNTPYYLNFYRYLFGQKTKRQYFADFDPKANDIYKAAEFITNYTLPGEKIFVWGNEPYLYALSRRLPTGRYIVAYHVIDFSGWGETLSAIEENQTKLIITTPVSGHDFPAMEGLLQKRYIKIKKVGEYQFYRKISN